MDSGVSILNFGMARNLFSELKSMDCLGYEQLRLRLSAAGLE